jgi:hypothetical protein
LDKNLTTFTQDKEQEMKRATLFLIALLTLAACSPTSPDSPEDKDTPQGFTATSVNGQWTADYKLFALRVEGKRLSTAPYGDMQFFQRAGTISVSGARIQLSFIDPFGRNPNETLFYDGAIDGSTITGHYWLNYAPNHVPLNFARTK